MNCGAKKENGADNISGINNNNNHAEIEIDISLFKFIVNKKDIFNDNITILNPKMGATDTK